MHKFTGIQKSEWWRDFFSGLTVDLWRQAISEDQTRTEADFIRKMFHLAPPARILDVPCGHGRLSLELASRGFDVTGVDISNDFLNQARSDGKNRGLKIAWELREMRDLPWQNEFDGAFCFGNSFGFLDDDGNADFLKAVYQVLKPGGRFILDAASVAENILGGIKDRSETQIGDISFIEENRYDHLLGRLDTEYTFIRGKQVEKRFGSHRIYTYREICELLTKAGFVNWEAYGSTGEELYQLGSRGLFFVAVKKS